MSSIQELCGPVLPRRVFFYAFLFSENFVNYLLAAFGRGMLLVGGEMKSIDGRSPFLDAIEVTFWGIFLGLSLGAWWAYCTLKKLCMLLTCPVRFAANRMRRSYIRYQERRRQPDPDSLLRWEEELEMDIGILTTSRFHDDSLGNQFFRGSELARQAFSDLRRHNLRSAASWFQRLRLWLKDILEQERFKPSADKGRTFAAVGEEEEDEEDD